MQNHVNKYLKHRTADSHTQCYANIGFTSRHIYVRMYRGTLYTIYLTCIHARTNKMYISDAKTCMSQRIGGMTESDSIAS